MISGACSLPVRSRSLMISIMSSLLAWMAFNASTSDRSLGEEGSTGSTPTKFARWRRAARLDHHVLVRHGHGADLHVAADDDRFRPLVDDHAGHGPRLHDRNRQDLRDERHRIVAVLGRNLDDDVALVVGVGDGGVVAHLLLHLPVDFVGDVLRDLEIGVELVQHEREVVVLGEGVEELLLQPAALMDAAAVGHVRVLQRDGPFREGVDPRAAWIGTDQRCEEQPSADEALGRADRADDAVDLVALPRRRRPV